MRKLIIFALVAVLVLTLSASAFASHRSYAPRGAANYGYGYCAGGYNYMWDADGDILSREDTEAKLDQYIKDGYIRDADKSWYLDRYDYCVEKGWDNLNCGFGRRAGRGCCGR